ncbi:MAG TPA: putative Ig domain-containing protein, partial [Solirubrobacteraceae bacterium]|nr:putative Ig domain-containing protein [Solirubrobacteraceae bacterium]
PGEIFGFGRGDQGELGPTTTAATNAAPLPVTLPGSVGQVIAVAAGGSYSMALTSSGQLYGFGEDNVGQTGSAPNPKQPTPLAVELAGASGQPTAVSAGGVATLVRTSGGQLFSFGLNTSGELGRPSGASKLVTLPGSDGPVTSVAEGGSHGLVVTASGQLYSFGSNEFGQLGDERSEIANRTPVAIALPGAIGGAVEVAAGSEHSLVLTSGGQVFAFGANNDGQLGRGGGFDNEVHSVPLPVVMPPSAGPVIQIAAGEEHNLALTAGGQLYAWGASGEGELGAEYGFPQPLPQLVTLPGAIGRIVKIGAGAESSLALTSSGQLYTFGSNESGQLGRAGNAGTKEENPTPTPVMLPEGATVDTLGGGCCGSQTLAVIADLSVATSALPGGLAGTPYSTTASASGGTPPYRWAAGALPAGIGIDATSGLLSGTPTLAGPASPSLIVTDAFGITASSAPLTLTIAPPPVVRKGGPVSSLAARIRAALLAAEKVAGKASKIGAILKHGYAAKFTAPSKGKLVVQWFFVPKGAHLATVKRTPVLVASAAATFTKAGTQSVRLKLTLNGRRLLKATPSRKLSAKGSFTPSSGKSVRAISTFMLHR